MSNKDVFNITYDVIDYHRTHLSTSYGFNWIKSLLSADEINLLQI